MLLKPAVQSRSVVNCFKDSFFEDCEVRHQFQGHYGVTCNENPVPIPTEMGTMDRMCSVSLFLQLIRVAYTKSVNQPDCFPLPLLDKGLEYIL